MLQALKLKNISVLAVACCLFAVITAPVFVSAAIDAPTDTMTLSVLSLTDDGSDYEEPSIVTETPAVEGLNSLPTSLVGLVSEFASLDAQELADEERCLAQAVYFEARSETLEGQLAVAQVVLNRLEDRRYPNSICGVVFQGEHRRHRCQFSFACDGLSDRPRNAQAWAIAKSISHIAIHNHWDDVTSLSTHYHADYVSPYWGDLLDQQVKVGRHIFYRDDSF